MMIYCEKVGSHRRIILLNYYVVLGVQQGALAPAGHFFLLSSSLPGYPLFTPIYLGKIIEHLHSELEKRGSKLKVPYKIVSKDR